jgi:methyltransferase-like protein
MALALPESTFVGIDLSARQLADGWKTIEALGLQNVALKHLDIMDVPADFGQFDYIIAHGVYSWVSPTAQDKILTICQQHLAPTGVAYVSYNTYPGWHMRGMIRDMMRYHTRQFDEAQMRIDQARALLAFLADAVPAENNAYGMLLKSELEGMSQRSNPYLFHEHLEEFNEPLYFYQFVERAARHGLQYLAEADFSAMLGNLFPSQVSETLRRVVSDIIHMEQYMDFVRNRMFRQTLLCHQGLPLRRIIEPEHMTVFKVASPAKPVSAKPDIFSTAVEEFRGASGTTAATGHAVSKAAMCYLADIWPQAVPFETLLATARARLAPEVGPKPDAAVIAHDTRILADSLLTCYTGRLVELHVHTPGFVLDISERPVASSLARFQARHSQDSTLVTNLRHENVKLTKMAHHLLRYLDGYHHRASLLEVLANLVAEGVLRVEEIVEGQDDKPVTEAEKLQHTLAEPLDLSLRDLARAALLVG